VPSLPIRLALLVAALAPLAASGAGAQAPTTRPAPASPANKPAAPIVVKVDGRRLKPGSWTYRTTVLQRGQSKVVERQMSLSSTSLAGTPAWLVVDSQGGGGPGGIADSLYLTRSDVLPLRHRLHTPQAALALDFGRDSVRGTMTLPQGSAPLVAPYARGAMVTGTMLELYLRLLPVKTGWTGSLTMGPVGPKGSTLVPVTLTASREETVTVPAGTFPTYVVTMHASGSEQTAWMTKDTHEIVKVTATFAQLPGASFETVLVSRR
jgi:hypothetical protein